MLSYCYALDHVLLQIRGRENFWNYTENVFIPTLYSYDWYNGDPDATGREESFVANKNMHLVGRARFRQLRIKNGKRRSEVDGY